MTKPLTPIVRWFITDKVRHLLPQDNVEALQKIESLWTGDIDAYLYSSTRDRREANINRSIPPHPPVWSEFKSWADGFLKYNTLTVPENDTPERPQDPYRNGTASAEDRYQLMYESMTQKLEWRLYRMEILMENILEVLKSKHEIP